MSGLILVLLSLTAVTVNSDKPFYKAIGDKVVLTPDSVSRPITSITWKHGPDIAVEWYNGQTQAYRHFKGRVMLNNLNGELTITGLTPDDSGSYTAEINNKPPTKPTQLQVISPVSKPSVSTWCHPDMTYCILTCEGNTTEAEPITYQWRTSDASWESTNVLNITKGEDEPWFGCSLQNPVSSESSEDVPSPFTKGDWVQVIIILIAVLLGILMVGFIYVNYKRRKEATTALQNPVSSENSEDVPSPFTKVDWVQAIIFLITLLGGFVMLYFIYVNYTRSEEDWVQAIIFLITLFELILIMCFVYVRYKRRGVDWENLIIFLLGLLGGIPLVCFFYVRYKHRKGVVYRKMTGRTGKQEGKLQWDWVQVMIILIGVLGGFLMMYFIYFYEKRSEGNWVQVIIGLMVPCLLVGILMVESCRSYSEHRKGFCLEVIIFLIILLGGILMVYFIFVSYTFRGVIWVGVIIGSITALVVVMALMVGFCCFYSKKTEDIWRAVMCSIIALLGWFVMVYFVYVSYKDREVDWVEVIIILLGVFGGILIMCFFYVDYKDRKEGPQTQDPTPVGSSDTSDETVTWLQVIIFPLGLLELILAVYFIYLYDKHSEGDRVGLIISVILLLLVVVVFVTLMVGFCCFYCKHRKGQGVVSPTTVIDTGTKEESSRMLPSVVSLHTNTVAVSSVILDVPEPQTQDSAPPVSTETSKETEGPQTQDPTPVGSSDTSDETEKPSEISETSDQDPTSHASKETKNSAVVSSSQETVGQEPPVDEQAAEDPRDDDQS